MKKFSKKENLGITLIALVITIIILLILAGVSINFIFGNEGIFTKTQSAVERYQNATEKENYVLAQVQEMVNNRDTVTIDKDEYEMLKNANSYSTVEKKVGTWIDGKSIYQKSFNVASLTSSGINIPNALPEDYEVVVDLFGIAHNTTFTQWTPIPGAHQTSINYNIRLTVNDNNSASPRSIDVIPGESFGSFDYIVLTIQYTKTTD